MSSQNDEYSFLNNIDQKVLIFTALLTVALVGGAIWLNIAVREDVACTPQKYIYCGEPAAHDHHHAAAEKNPH